MPRGNGTGPMGMGPRTGRGMGYCSGYNTPGYMNGGYGYGRGRGYRHMYYATGVPGWGRGYGFVPNATDERDFLKDEARFLEDQLKYIKDRLDDLDRKHKEDE
ncbi:MAG: DUF5320 domain-containing protein [Thermoanaerobacteraceae bacterium]